MNSEVDYEKAEFCETVDDGIGTLPVKDLLDVGGGMNGHVRRGLK